MGRFISGDIVPFDFYTKTTTVVLRRDVIYVDDHCVEWIAPKGMVSDGTSMPPILWPFLGHPFSGCRFKSSLIHDSAYQCALPEDASIWRAMRSEDRKAADDVYLEAMEGEEDKQREAIYRGVRLGGWWAWYRHARKNRAEMERANG
jgi:hypothetical protein